MGKEEQPLGLTPDELKEVAHGFRSIAEDPLQLQRLNEFLAQQKVFAEQREQVAFRIAIEQGSGYAMVLPQTLLSPLEFVASRLEREYDLVDPKHNPVVGMTVWYLGTYLLDTSDMQAEQALADQSVLRMGFSQDLVNGVRAYAQSLVPEWKQVQ